jgi:patatin-like phospholipase/acyl hydrolase
MTWRILTLDGGGLRGLVTTVLLERLTTSHAGLLDKVDLFAGTSIGGMLALGLAAGIPLADFRQAFLEQGPAIILDSARPPHLQNVARYDNFNLRRFLQEMFGEKRLGDLPRKVLVTAFALDARPERPDQLRRSKPKIFHNFDDQSADPEQFVVDVALATAAVPVVFPIHKGYVDGGVFAVHPGMCALAQAIDPHTGGRTLEQIAMLSVGTGRNPDYIEVPDRGDWGWEQWSVDYRIMWMMLGNDREMVDFQCSRLLGERYQRINPLLGDVVRLDDAFALPRLLMTAMQTDLGDITPWLRRWF